MRFPIPARLPHLQRMVSRTWAQPITNPDSTSDPGTAAQGFRVNPGGNIPQGVNQYMVINHCHHTGAACMTQHAIKRHALGVQKLRGAYAPALPGSSSVRSRYYCSRDTSCFRSSGTHRSAALVPYLRTAQPGADTASAPAATTSEAAPAVRARGCDALPSPSPAMPGAAR